MQYKSKKRIRRDLGVGRTSPPGGSHFIKEGEGKRKSGLALCTRPNSQMTDVALLNPVLMKLPERLITLNVSLIPFFLPFLNSLYASVCGGKCGAPPRTHMAASPKTPLLGDGGGGGGGGVGDGGAVNGNAGAGDPSQPPPVPLDTMHPPPMKSDGVTAMQRGSVAESHRTRLLPHGSMKRSSVSENHKSRVLALSDGSSVDPVRLNLPTFPFCFAGKTSGLADSWITLLRASRSSR